MYVITYIPNAAICVDADYGVRVSCVLVGRVPGAWIQNADGLTEGDTDNDVLAVPAPSVGHDCVVQERRDLRLPSTPERKRPVSVVLSADDVTRSNDHPW